MRGLAAMGSGAMALAVVGCAAVPMPDVAVPYYLPMAEDDLTLTVVAGCSYAGQVPTGVVTSTRVDLAARYVPDLGHPDQDRLRLRYGQAAGTLSDADVTLNLQPDGRLIGVNAQSTGEGAAAVAAVAKLAAQAVPMLGGAFVGGAAPVRHRPADLAQVCGDIARFGAGAAPAEKLLTLIYHLNIATVIDQSSDWQVRPVVIERLATTPDLQGDAGTSPDFVPDRTSAATMAAIGRADAARDPAQDRWIGRFAQFGVRAQLEPTGAEGQGDTLLPIPSGRDVLASREARYPAGAAFVPLWLNRVGIVRLAVDGDLVVGAEADGTVRFARRDIWSTETYTPSREIYAMPVQRGRAFGGGTSELSVTDSGLLTRVHYARKSAVADMAGSVSAALAAIPSPAARDQAAADRIYQQQRLVICQTDPGHCSGS